MSSKPKTVHAHERVSVRTLRVEGGVTVRPSGVLQTDVTLQAPGHVDARTEFIAELRAWATALEAEVCKRRREIATTPVGMRKPVIAHPAYSKRRPRREVT